MKRRHDSKKMCTSSLISEFPEDCRFYPADTRDELHKVSQFRLILSQFFPRRSLVDTLNFMNHSLQAIFVVSSLSSLTLFYVLLVYNCSSCGFSRSKGSQFLTGEVDGLTSWLKRWSFYLYEAYSGIYISIFTYKLYHLGNKIWKRLTCMVGLVHRPPSMNNSYEEDKMDY